MALGHQETVTDSKMEPSYRCCFLFLVLHVSVAVSSQEPIELSDVRLYTEGGLLFGGAVEVQTPNGWERVCYDGFNSQMADVVCHKRGFDEGAMAVRSSASLGITVDPLPSLACQFSSTDGEEVVQCEYASACSDHAVVICNYPGYLGCYRHTRTSPSLDEVSFAYANMTVQLCLSLCRQQGYPHAGVAFGQECYCEAQGIDALASQRLDNEDCFLPCVGDPLQICGGGTAVGIYDSRLGSCNSLYTDAEGAIATPGFPGQYSNDERCTWTVRVPDAANITVQVRGLGLGQGDRISVAAPQAVEFVAFEGGVTPANIRFESTSHSLDARLEFTFTGGAITVTFNSTMTSLGAEGVVITFMASMGPAIDPSMQINMTVDTPEPTTTMTSQTTPQTTTAATTAATAATSPETVTSRDRPTTSPFTVSVPSDDNETTTATAAMTAASTVPVEGVLSTATPRMVTMVNAGGSEEEPSIVVIIAIVVGIALIFLLILTIAVLFTTSHKHDRKRNRRHNNGHVNAAYDMSNEDMQTDSGIYDPGYETADVEEPIYLSIRNDPRPRSTYYCGSEGHESDSNPSLSRTASVKTTTTDHDYQSVDGVSRRNTERSYISICPDSKQSSFVSGGRVSPVQASSGACDVAEDGYMIPTPKNSTQIQQTKL